MDRGILGLEDSDRLPDGLDGGAVAFFGLFPDSVLTGRVRGQDKVWEFLQRGVVAVDGFDRGPGPVQYHKVPGSL